MNITPSTSSLPANAYSRSIGEVEKLAILGAVLAGDTYATVGAKHGLPKLRVHTIVCRAGFGPSAA